MRRIQLGIAAGVMAAMVLVGSVAIATSSGCARATENVTTDAGRRAVVANEVLTRVERLQDAVIASAGKPGGVPMDTARAIVFATVEIAEAADAAQIGWQATVRQIWGQAKRDIPYLSAPGPVTTLVAAVDELMITIPVQGPQDRSAAPRDPNQPLK